MPDQRRNISSVLVICQYDEWTVGWQLKAVIELNSGTQKIETTKQKKVENIYRDFVCLISKERSTYNLNNMKNQ